MKFAYDVLARSKDTIDALPADVVGALGKVWNHGPPSKVLVFSWKILRDKIPPKENLIRLGWLLLRSLGVVFVENF